MVVQPSETGSAELLDGETSVDEKSCIVPPFEVPTTGEWVAASHLAWSTHVSFDLIYAELCVVGGTCSRYFAQTGQSNTPYWQSVEVDLAPGTSIELQWCVDDTSLGGSVPTDGLYVDDVMIGTEAAVYALTHP